MHKSRFPAHPNGFEGFLPTLRLSDFFQPESIEEHRGGFRVENYDEMVAVYGMVPIQDFVEMPERLSDRTGKQTQMCIDISSVVGAKIVFASVDKAEEVRERLRIGVAPDAIEAPTFEERLRLWFQRGKIGRSSHLIAYVLAGLRDEAITARLDIQRFDHARPCDKSDLNRCLQLINWVGGDHPVEPKIDRLRHAGPSWSQAIDELAVLSQPEHGRQ